MESDIVTPAVKFISKSTTFQGFQLPYIPGKRRLSMPTKKNEITGFSLKMRYYLTHSRHQVLFGFAFCSGFNRHSRLKKERKGTSGIEGICLWGSSSPRWAQEGLRVTISQAKDSGCKGRWVTDSGEHRVHNARGGTVEVWSIWVHYNKQHCLLPAKPRAIPSTYI